MMVDGRIGPDDGAEERPARGDPADDFVCSLVAWMKGCDYQVGLTGRKIDCPRVIEWAKEKWPEIGRTLQLGGVSAAVAASLVTMLVTSTTGGASAEDVAETLRPFGPHVDILGLKVANDLALLLPVLFADDIPVEELSVYVEMYGKFASSLKKLVAHGIFANPRVFCEAIFVYFDAEKAAAARLNPGDLYFDQGRVTVRGAVADVQQRKVTQAKPDTIGGIISDGLGFGSGEFDTMALCSVLLPPRRRDRPTN
jgi:hypothetical protein